MPSKYSRKNRDRRGGHKNSPLVGDKEMMINYLLSPNDNFYTGNITRACIKKATKKRARSQNTRFILEGLKDYEQEQQDYIKSFWGFDDEDNQFLPPEEYREDAYFDESPFHDPYDTYFLDFCDPLPRWDDDIQPENVIVKCYDTGKTIRELCEEHGFTVSTTIQSTNQSKESQCWRS